MFYRSAEDLGDKRSFYKQLTFEVDDHGAVFSVFIGYDFLHGALHMLLEGPMNSLSYRKRLATHSENQVFFVNETLSAGRYQLTISDPFVMFDHSMSPNGDVGHSTLYNIDVTCIPVTISYSLLSRSDRPIHKPYLLEVAAKAGFTRDSRTRDCGVQMASVAGGASTTTTGGAGAAGQLPTDLFSADGGASELGGTQHATTGSMHLFGDSFIFRELSEIDSETESGIDIDEDGVEANPGSAAALPHHDIAFKVLKPSVFRVYASADTAGYRFKFIVYDSDGKSGEKRKVLAVTGGGVDTIETNEHAVSLHTRLQPPADGRAYVLSIVYLHSDTPATECVTYSLLIALDTIERLELAQTCDGDEPSRLPFDPANRKSAAETVASGGKAAPKPVQIGGAKNVDTFGAYYFTSQFMSENEHAASSENPNDKVFRYRIPLQVLDDTHPDPKHGVTPFTALSVMLGFNVLNTHFSLYLKDSQDRVIVRGVETPSPALNRDQTSNDQSGLAGGDENFGVALEASLLPGLYSLDIEQERSEVDTIGQLSKIAHARKELHHCTHFVFGLEASSAIGAELGPAGQQSCYVESVEPRGGIKLDPTFDLTVVVQFSCPVLISSITDARHAHTTQLANALWLQPLFSRAVRVPPSTVKFQSRDLTRLIAVFDHKHFAGAEHDFRLVFDFFRFHPANADGTAKPGAFMAHAQPFATRHTYHFTPVLAKSEDGDSAAGGDGMPGLGLGVEMAASVHSGPAAHVSSTRDCPSGQHRSGLECVADVKCLPQLASCSGHGYCDDLRGYPTCTCMPGFASSGDHYCNACDSPHHKYPDCDGGGDAGEQFRSNTLIRVDCDGASTLPHSLNAPGLIRGDSVSGHDLEHEARKEGRSKANAAAKLAHPPTTPAVNYNRVHLHDVFLINPEVSEESIEFSIGVESAFRVYYLLLTESFPKEALAMTLYHDNSAMQEGTQFEREGGMYLILSPGRYRLVFAYSSAIMQSLHRTSAPAGGSASCIKWNVELALEPVAMAVEHHVHSTLHKVVAPADTHLSTPHGAPDPEALPAYARDNHPISEHCLSASVHPNLPALTEPISAHTGYHYRSNGKLTHNGVDASAVTGTESGFVVWHWEFTVPDVIEHTAFIVAELQFDFLLGHLRLGLKHGVTNEHWMSDISQNVNSLRMPLTPGPYSLMVYQPMPQLARISPCVLYDLEFKIGFVRLPKAYSRAAAAAKTDHTSEADIETDLLIEQCTLRALPVNLNIPGLMGANGTEMHVHDRFRYNPMSTHHVIRFHLAAPRSWARIVSAAGSVPGAADTAPSTLFRLHVPMHQTNLRFAIVLTREDAPVPGSVGKTKPLAIHTIESTHDTDSMHLTLADGSYSLRLTLDPERPLPTDASCLGVVMEIGILPLTEIHPFESLKEHLPTIPECPAVPFVSESLVPYIAQLNEKHIESGSVVLKSYPIEIRYKDTLLEAELESDFIRGPMVLALTHVRGATGSSIAHVTTPTVMGVSQRNNYQSIRRVLRPGFYELSLRLLAPADSEIAGYNQRQSHTPDPSADPFAAVHPVPDDDGDGLNHHDGTITHASGVPGSVETIKKVSLKNGGSLWVRFDLTVRLHETTPFNSQLNECLDDDLTDSTHSNARSGVLVLPAHLNRIAFSGTELGAGHFNTHFFARFLYPSVHAKYVHLSRPHTETTQFVVPSTSLFRVAINSESALTVRLFEMPCSKVDARSVAAANGAHDSPTRGHSVHSWLSAVHGWRTNPLTHPRLGAKVMCRPRQIAVVEEEHTIQFARYLPPGTYELEITEEDPKTEADGEIERARSSCASYEMEVALRSLHHSGVAPSCPLTHGAGADHLPPHPPHTITEYYSYDSTRLGETLYFSKRYGQSHATHLIFEVKTPFRLFSEVGYEFLTGDLTIDLTRMSPTSVDAFGKTHATTGGPDEPESGASTFSGRAHMNRHVLGLDFVSAGMWMLSIHEPVASNGVAFDASWFCTRFTFRLEIDPILTGKHSFRAGSGPELTPLLLSTPLQTAIPHIPYLPQTLDSMAYLYHDGAMHFSGTYALVPRQFSTRHRHTTTAVVFDDRRAHNQIHFTLERVSLVRITIAPRHHTAGTGVGARASAVPPFAVNSHLIPHSHRTPGHGDHILNNLQFAHVPGSNGVLHGFTTLSEGAAGGTGSGSRVSIWCVRPSLAGRYSVSRRF